MSMSSIIYGFLALPLFPRITISLFFILAFWWVLGHKILWIASLLPFLLNKIFRYIYVLVELPVSKLHKKFGAIYYKIENGMSHFGKKIDTVLFKWYEKWHDSRRVQLRSIIIVYILLIMYIAVPSSIGLKGNILLSGQKGFIYSESALIGWFEQLGWLDKSEQASKDESGLMMIVFGTGSSLGIRDVPTTQNCKMLGSIRNGDTVLWNGDLKFGVADDGKIEPWVKIVTVDGVEGWSRLRFLYPENHDELEFHLKY